MADTVLRRAVRAARASSVPQGLHAAGIVHTPDGLAQQVCYRQDGELWEHVLWCHGDGVGDDDFTEHPTAEALDGWGAEHGMASAGIHLREAARAAQSTDVISTDA